MNPLELTALNRGIIDLKELSEELINKLRDLDKLFYQRRYITAYRLGGNIHLDLISDNGGINNRSFIKIDPNNKTYSINVSIPERVEKNMFTIMQREGYVKK